VTFSPVFAPLGGPLPMSKVQWFVSIEAPSNSSLQISRQSPKAGAANKVSHAPTHAMAVDGRRPKTYFIFIWLGAEINSLSPFLSQLTQLV
jgi:hypothetical protein